MSHLADQFPKSKTFRTVLTGAFVGFWVVQYPAFFEGLRVAMAEYFGSSGAAVLVCVLTAVFRLDLIAAVLGFYGEWKIWGWPLWACVLVTVLFQALSLVVMFGPGGKPPVFWKWMPWVKKAQAPEVRGEET